MGGHCKMLFAPHQQIYAAANIDIPTMWIFNDLSQCAMCFRITYYLKCIMVASLSVHSSEFVFTYAHMQRCLQYRNYENFIREINISIQILSGEMLAQIFSVY